MTSSDYRAAHGRELGAERRAVRIVQHRAFRDALARPVLGEHPLHRRPRIRVGRTLRVFRRGVDVRLDLGGDRRFELFTEYACVAELLAEARQRILLLELGELLCGAVFRLLVVRGVGGEPDDLRLDERGAVAAAGAVHCLFRRLVAAQHVRAVDDDAGDAVAGSASRHVRQSQLLGDGHADRVAVVLDAQDERQLVDRREVESFVDVALVRAALAHRRQRHLAGLAELRGQGDAHRVEHLGRDRRRQRDEVVGDVAVVARHLAPAR